MDLEDEQPLEYNLCGLTFQQQGAISYFAEHLPPEAVGIPSGNTGLYEFYLALLDFYSRTGLDPIDTIAFKSWLESETDLYAALGGGVVVQTFIDTVTSLPLSTPEAVTGVLKDRYNTRKQLDAIEELKQVVGRKEIKTEEDRTKLSFLTDQIRILSSSIRYNPYDALETSEDLIARADKIWDLPDFMPTQYEDLNLVLGYDKQKGGIVKGAVHSIIAASGFGKSTFAKCLVNHWVNCGRTSLFINYEEAISHWERILFTQITGHNVYMETSLEQKSLLNKVYREKLSEWGDRFMVRHDPETPYFDDLERWIYDLVGFNNNIPDVIVIDTIQSMFTKGGGGKPRWGQYEEMMVRLEKLAKDTGAAIIITAQENSNRMKERREEVQQSDAGGSLTIIQKSTFSIFITKKKIASGDDSEDDRIMELQIPKNRITGATFMKQPPLVYYNDNTKSYEPFDLNLTTDRYEDYDYSRFEVV